MNISDDIKEPIDFPFTLDELKAEGYTLIGDILQDPNHIIEPLICEDSKPSFNEANGDGYKCLVCNIALFRLKEVIGHILTLHCSKGNIFLACCLLAGQVKLYTPPRLSEISTKNWRAKVEPVLKPHL